MSEINFEDDSEQTFPILVRTKRASVYDIARERAKAGLSNETLADKILKWGSMFVLLPGVGPIGAKPTVGGYRPMEGVVGQPKLIPTPKPVDLGITNSGFVGEDMPLFTTEVTSFENPSYVDDYNPVELDHITHEDAVQTLNPNDSSVSEGFDVEMEPLIPKGKKTSTPKPRGGRKKGAVMEERAFNETEGQIRYANVDEPVFVNKGMDLRGGKTKWNEIELNNISNITQDYSSAADTTAIYGVDFGTSSLSSDIIPFGDGIQVSFNPTEELWDIDPFEASRTFRETNELPGESRVVMFKPPLGTTFVIGGGAGGQMVPTIPSEIKPVEPIIIPKPINRGGIERSRFNEPVTKKRKKKHVTFLFL